MRFFSLCALALLLSACRSEVHAQLDEAQANEVVRALSAHGFIADKEPGSVGHFSVTVPSRELGAALAVLAAEALPRKNIAGLELIGQGDALVPSFLSEQAQLARALAGELERTLGALSHVERVKVQLAFAQAEPALLAPAGHRLQHASIVLRTSGDVDVGEVKAVVVAAVADLAPNDVTVTMQKIAPTENATPTLERVGPFFVAATSRAPLFLTLVIGLSVLLLLALLLMVQAARATRASR